MNDLAIAHHERIRAQKVWVPETSSTAAELLLRSWRCRHDPPTALKLIYPMFAKLPSWMVLYVRCDTANEIKILVLRINWPCRSDAHPGRDSIGQTAP